MINAWQANYLETLHHWIITSAIYMGTKETKGITTKIITQKGISLEKAA